MIVVQRIFIAVLMALSPTASRAQENPATPPQSSKEPSGREKEKIEEETRKRLEQLACSPSGVKFSHRTEKGPQILPERPPDKGLIYVIRKKTWLGAAVQLKLAMDRKWVGTNRIGNYFYFEVDPGPHYFCMKVPMSDPGFLSLVIEKGKTYYLEQSATMGGIDLNLLTEEEGKAYVAKYHKSLFEEKLKK